MTIAVPETVRVLLVEDDEDDYILVRHMLREIPGTTIDLDWATDFDTGLKRLCDMQHDVCLVDYRLGPHDGVEFVRESIAQDCRVPVILLTGLGDRALDVTAMKAGAADFLHKQDLKPSDLDRSIRYAMQHRRSEDQRIRLLTERTARERAESANRAKDEFLATLSHELRTPLSPVLMAIDTMEQENGLSDRTRELLGLIRRNVELEARLIDDLLDVTRIANRKIEIRREVVDVHAQVRHAVETCNHGVDPNGKQVSVSVRSEAPNHHVLGDPARLQQIFWNLLKNAVKFTPAGGRVDVLTRNEPAAGDGAAPGSTVMVIEVRDSGIGIDAEALPKIFNAFEQVESAITRKFGGLGLGLAICKALVDLHGGSIQVESPGRGQGATFTVKLTTVPAPAGLGLTPGPVSPVSPVGPARKGRILLVEDHPDTRKLMSKLLQKAGHQVEAADSVAAAVATARDNAFDLVISDIGLPDGTGLDLIRQLLDIRPIRGIALSGYGMESDIQLSREAGFTIHLTKPVNVRQLHEAVAALLDQTVSTPTPATAG